MSPCQRRKIDAIEILRFDPELLRRPAATGIDAVTTLRHFSIVTYAVPPERVRPLIDDRFDLDCINLNGAPKALLSVVKPSAAAEACR
jgi:hypothetical protein